MYLGGGLPEIWQSLIYYGCLILALVAAVRITRKQKKQSKHKFRGKQKTEKGIFHKIKVHTAVMLLFVILAAGILVLSWKDRSGLRITCLDVGQGDGIVLEMPEGGAFLMDCGSSNQKKYRTVSAPPLSEKPGDHQSGRDHGIPYGYGSYQRNPGASGFHGKRTEFCKSRNSNTA